MGSQVLSTAGWTQRTANKGNGPRSPRRPVKEGRNENLGHRIHSKFGFLPLRNSFLIQGNLWYVVLLGEVLLVWMPRGFLTLERFELACLSGRTACGEAHASSIDRATRAMLARLVV